jgi:amino acid adenylation domain-containing protein
MSKAGNIEAIYPLSPMQEGILFHTLYTPHSAGYSEQFSYTLEGDLNVPAFEQAWQTIVARHPILRTLFTWEKRNQPLQIVRQKVTVPFAYQDWRSYSPSEQQAQLEAFLIADRKQGFDLSKAPLMRLALMRLSQRRYQFTWSFHHLLLDGWSSPIILAELFALYEGFCRAESPALPPRRPYRDYIRWLQQQDLSQAEQFWRAYLDGFATPTPFGVDKPDSKGQAEAYAKQDLVLPEAVSGPLQQLAQQHHLTMSTLIQGVWAIILSRYSNEREVVFGTTVSGRAAPLKDIDNMVGLFINTLPLRVRVRPDVSFLEWLQALQARQSERRLYEHSPLPRIQQWSDLPANVPLFECILALGNYPVPHQTDTEQRSLAISEVRLFEQTNYPLTVQVMPGEQLLWRLQYDCHRFDDATITRMLGHIQILLEAIVADPDRPVGQLPWLTEIEQQQLLTDWNPPATDEPPRQSIAALFEVQVSRTPEAIAVVYEDQHLTYAELNRQSNQLAHHLQQMGIKPNDFVAMYMDRSLETVIGIIGILKAGGAYLPLDSAYPAERLAFMLQDSQAPILLTQTKMADDLPAYQGQILCLDRDWGLLAKANDNNPETVVAPTDTAYVIYTSGSTGKPKGVLVSHGNVVRLFTSTQHWFNFDENDVWTLFHSYAFDFSVWEIWGALLYGGRLIVVPYWISRSFEAFYKLLRQEKVTVLNQTPSAFRQLIRAEETVGVAPDLALRLVIFGGEALDLQGLRPWFERHPDTVPQLVNMYGITETTVHVTYRAIQASDLETASGSVIGVPIPDLQLYILDPHQQPVPIGVTGEMYVGGAGVAQGYLNRPKLTAARFIANPFTHHNDDHELTSRLYRTGDLARFLPERDIEYLGRIDHQVKIRGFRIELEEIEANLTRHPAIRESIVVAHKQNTETTLVAYLVTDQHPRPIMDDLRAYLKRRLPDYMVPATFIFLEALPLTPNGKIDRKALPEPGTSRPKLAESYVAPKTEIEQTIATIWQEVLGLDKVGRHDNFFDLGGHSLRMVQVHSKLKVHFEQELPMIKLFEHPTIAAMGQFLSQGQNGTVDRSPKIDQVQDRAARQKMARAKKRQGPKIRRKQE